jgi:hypothetical protein
MHDTNTVIFHSLSSHDELIITNVIADAIPINQLTQLRHVETGFSTGLDSLGKDIPSQLYKF